MKKRIFRKPIRFVICYLFLSNLALIGQVSTGSYQGYLASKPEKPRVVYYPIYQGRQVVEVDLFHFYNQLTRHENSVAYHERGQSASSLKPMPNCPNLFLIRDSEGAILQSFYPNLDWRTYFNESELLPPAVAPITPFKSVFDSIQFKPRNAGYFSHCPRMTLPYFQVQHLGLVGVLDTLGNTIVQPNLYTWLEMNGKYSVVKVQDGKYGLLGSKWDEVYPPIFSSLLPLAVEGFYIACEEKCGMISVNQEVLVPFEYDWVPADYAENDPYCEPWYIPVRNEKGWGFISPFDIGKEWGYEAVIENALGFMVKKGNDYAWVNCNGERVTDFLYNGWPPEQVAEDLFLLHKGDPSSAFERLCLMDRRGKLLVKKDFEEIAPLGEGQFMGMEGGKAFLMDQKQGIIPVKDAEYYRDLGKYLGAKIGGQWYILNRDGTVFHSEPFRDISLLHGNFFSVGLKNDKEVIWKVGYGLLNGKEHSTIIWDPVGMFWTIEENSFYRLWDTLGNDVLKRELEGFCPFHLGNAIVEVEEGCGVIDLMGNWVIQPKYSRFMCPDWHYGNMKHAVYDPIEGEDVLQGYEQGADGVWRMWRLGR